MATGTESKSERKDDGRATIGLDKSTVESVDKIRKRIGEALKAEHGVAVEPTRAQVVASLVKDAASSAG